MALPIRVQSASNTSVIASVAVTLGSTPIANNLLVAIVQANVGSGSVAISGWTSVGNIAVGITGSIDVFSKFAGVGESATVTATGTLATLMDLHVYEYSGVDGTVPTVASTADSGSGVTSLSAGTIALSANATSLVIAVVATALGNGGSVSWTNGMSAGISTSDLMTADLVNFTNASRTTSASWATSQRAAGMILSFLQSQGNSYYRGGGK